MWHCHLFVSVAVCVWLAFHSSIIFSEANGANIGSNVKWVIFNINVIFYFIQKYNMVARQIMPSGWMKFQIFSSLKPHVWWNCSKIWIFLIWPSKKFVVFLSIRNQRWPSMQVKDLSRDLMMKWMYFFSLSQKLETWSTNLCSSEIQDGWLCLAPK